ncbi:MmgE/PrpD family protein [Cupriavidus sp. AU9028]|uniref:MmgE/PrpD family protein n=1 Tax=Cupriavidus sp. AU9028 TaxID=2871157 RepID=UPI001C948D84|nr:MmgE/PrpD family protein [Cupriavidus sp. AU9028]MBY4895879.1 MmgE/PrpD family protein [Cupriavidus sp. AU9028]
MDPSAKTLTGYTQAVAQWISTVNDEEIGAAAFVWARHALLDWLAVSIAAADEPLVRMLADEYGDEDGPCSLLRGGGARPADAALINGSAGHALDFDDVASAMRGHPTVPVAPAALALAQLQGSSGRELLRALVIGHEIESRIGERLGDAQYRFGLHPTGTTGALGAAAACARLMALDQGSTAHALGLAATQASGLKSMFGTMAKPLHAGKAAMHGVMAARLAARGFTANTAALECPQGFAATQAPGGDALPDDFERRDGMAIEKTLFKYHASCYLTHSTLEAVAQLRRQHGLELHDMESMTVLVAGPHRGVCDIASPRTGLEIKFAIQHLAAMALDGRATASLDAYTEQQATDPRLVRARERVALRTDQPGERNTATVEIHTRDGRTLRQSANVAVPAKDLDQQWQKLAAKAQAIVTPVLGAARFGRLVEAVQSLDRLTSVDPLFEAIR